MPARSPSTSLRNSRPTSRPSLSRPALVVPTILADSASGRRSAQTTSGQGRRAGGLIPVSPGRRTERELEGGVLTRRQRSAQARRRERSEQDEALPVHAQVGRKRPGASSGLTRIGPPGASVNGVEPRARASGPYSPFGSSTATCRPNAACRSRYVFTSALFPAPDLAEHRDVRVRHGPGRVQLERIVGEGPADEVLTDEHPARRQRAPRRRTGRPRRAGPSSTRAAGSFMRTPVPSEACRYSPPPAHRTGGGARVASGRPSARSARRRRQGPSRRLPSPPGNR